jgi:hypothetical protein
MGKASQNNMLRFVKKNPAIISSLKGKDIFFPVILAIGYAESGFGTSNAAKNRNNYFGIGNGQTSFSTPQQAFEFQANLFYKEPYTKLGVTSAKDPYEQLRKIADSGYYSANNDFSLPANQRPPYKKWTAKQSADKYYNTLKGFIDDALAAIPAGKITDQNASQIIASL